MKKIFYTTLAALLAFSLNAQVTYVDQDAQGNNDGSSWSNAYTDLQDALANTEAGSIWVAAGLYPTGSDTAAVFSIEAPIELLGGFAGTESSPDERDISQNETILSGDLDGNDDGDFMGASRDDNSSHVLYIDSMLTAAVVIDGFTIKGAQANLVTSDEPDYEWRGGGIYALSAIEVANCLFTENAARSGASILLFGSNTDNSTVSNCQFTDNFTNNQAAAILAESTSHVSVEDCTFEGNTTVRGCIYPLRSNAFEVRNCTFENNTNEEGTSAGIFAWQPTELFIDGCSFRNNLASSSTCMYIDQRDLESGDPSALVRIQNCTFEENTNPGGFSAGLYFWQPKKLELVGSDFLNNQAGNAAGIYIDQRDVAPDVNSILIDSCLFQGNETTDYGGSGIYFWNGNFTITNTQFINNSAPSAAPAIYMGGDEDNGSIVNCEFTGNNASFAGAIANYNGLSNLVIQGSVFDGNSALNGGGALSAGFLGRVFVEESVFENNEAGYGGAVFVQNDSSEFSAVNTDFIGNITNSTSGGAVLNNSSNPLFIDGCYFELNSSNTVGGAISAIEDSLDLSFLTLRNSIFNFNIAGTQGGALNISNADAIIESCVFTNNNALADGIGGAISLNSSTGGASDDLQVQITNSTIADNLGDLVAGIASWTDGIATSTLAVQNNIFAQRVGLDYDIEDGTPEIVSDGGNLTFFDLQPDIFDHPMDIIGADPLFTDIDDYDFSVQEGSPCIDAGVESGAPELDVLGNPRVDQVDIGAYENQKLVNTQSTVVFDTQQLAVFPNPVRTNAMIRVSNDWTGEVQFRALGMNGQLLQQWVVDKSSGTQSFPIQVDGWPSGAYKIIANHNGSSIGSHLMKP